MIVSDTKGEKKAVFILEDEPRVLQAWMDALRDGMKEVGHVLVIGSQDADEGWQTIKDAQQDGYGLAVVIVDLVKGKGVRSDREWGIRFLRNVKAQFPNVFRVVFSGQLERPEIQRILDEGLVHDFEDKGPHMDRKAMQRMIEKVKHMVHGINVGNIRSPSAKQEFESMLERWIESLPEKRDTEIRGLDGLVFRAGELLSNPQLREDFRKAFEAIRLDEIGDVSERGKKIKK